MIPLTNKENQSYHEQGICYKFKKECSTNDKEYYKVRDYCHNTGSSIVIEGARPKLVCFFS